MTVAGGQKTETKTYQPPEMWRSMSDAPRDGKVIEVRNTIGSRGPTFGLYRRQFDSYPTVWEGVGPTEGGRFMAGDYATWRPYEGRVEDYVSPSTDIHDWPGWRRRSAVRAGVPADYYELIEKPPARPWLLAFWPMAAVAVLFIALGVWWVWSR